LAAAVLRCASEPRLRLPRRTWEATRTLISEELHNFIPERCKLLGENAFHPHWTQNYILPCIKWLF
jgi:hypothetical protein